jgi:toxin ParE1/3/4
MKYTLIFHPEVEGDVLLAYNWYETKANGLGEELLRIFYVYVGELTRTPFSWLKVEDECRRRLLRRFPYAIYYIVRNQQVIVIGLFHAARDPGTIKKIVKNRS